MESALEAPFVSQGLKPEPKRHDITGYICCVAVVITWVAQSEIAQSVQTHGYDKPMAITWFNHSCGVFIAPLMWIFGMQPRAGYQELIDGIPRNQLMRRALSLGALYLFADWVWYVGLPYTSVAMGTSIFNTSSCWVYALSLFLGQPHRWRQTAALLGSLAGVMVVSVTEAGDLTQAVVQGDELVGNGLVLLAAMGYAVYDVFLDRAFHGMRSPPSTAATSTFLVICSALNAMLLWPVLLVLAAPVWPEWITESFALPSGPAVAALCLNASLATCFNVCFALAIMRTSPIVASLSCVLTIPVSLVVDVVLHGDSFGSLKVLGAALIVLSFLLLAFDRAKA